MKIEDMRHSNLANEIEKHDGVDNGVLVAIAIIVTVCFLIYAAVTLLEVATIV